MADMEMTNPRPNMSRALLYLDMPYLLSYSSSTSIECTLNCFALSIRFVELKYDKEKLKNKLTIRCFHDL
jgi:hypothetical protein